MKSKPVSAGEEKGENLPQPDLGGTALLIRNRGDPAPPSAGPGRWKRIAPVSIDLDPPTQAVKGRVLH